MRLAFALLLLMTGAAQAGWCDPTIDLSAEKPDAAPSLYRVREGVARTVFQVDESTGDLCPSADPSCQGSAYLIGGDYVVVTSAEDDYLCASFTSDGRKTTITAGWLPAADLEALELPPAKLEDFAGHWGSGEEQVIDIVVEGDRLAINGDATFGATIPERVESGRVNVGGISASAVPEGNLVAWFDGLDGAEEWQPGNEHFACAVRIWALPPYIVASDNHMCGGMGVSFSGVYARALESAD